MLTGNPFDADIFPVSSGAASCTQKTKLCDAFFNGNKEDPVSLIDTIGFDDPSTDNDAETIAELIDKLKNACDHVNCFVLAVNGQNPRLDGSLVAMIRLFEGMFGPNFWKQMVVVFTRMSMDKKNIKKRFKSTGGKKDDEIAKAYMNEVKIKFGTTVPDDLQFLFIDSCFDADDDEEKKAFDSSVLLLRELIFSSMGLPTKTMEAVATENQKMKQKLKKAEDKRKSYEAKAKAARKEQENIELKYKLQIENIEKERLEKERKLLEEKNELTKEAFEAKRKMIEEHAAKEKAEEKVKQDERLRAQKEANEALDRVAKEKGFSWWDIVPIVGGIRRIMID